MLVSAPGGTVGCSIMRRRRTRGRGGGVGERLTFADYSSLSSSSSSPCSHVSCVMRLFRRGQAHHGQLGQGNDQQVGIVPGDLAALPVIDLGSDLFTAAPTAAPTGVPTSLEVRGLRSCGFLSFPVGYGCRLGCVRRDRTVRMPLA